MQIVYHLGAHGSDQGKLVRTLLRNREELWKQGIEIPAPSRYRGIFGEAINSLNGGEATAELQGVLRDLLIDNEHAERVILTQSPFLGIPQRAISSEGLYPRAPNRLPGLSNLFPDSVVEFHLAVVHPATQVIALMTQNKGDYHGIINGADPRRLRWAPSVRAMVASVPDREFVVWAQEDLAFTWPEVMRRMAGVTPDMPLVGDDVVLAELLSPEILHDLQANIDATPDLTIRARRNLVEQALSAAGTIAAMEGDVVLPGWTQELIDELSEIYAEDLDELAAISGVEFISA
ncbi:hypothetical protein [Paracoccus xiamenensis]|uniref:hypothetical protein n=1 Tax=Paracoccus xiamenensis TaxID=2714901 RepID=UPI0014076794|nr:hypothetical protein [Paracoccus xiamenensis]NHF73716.1 hypothetical protein [Paracoccus xiamenensis]